jgi:hypothetical protein
MNGPTIFIASSGKAKGRAKDLRNRLNRSESFRHVNLWSDVFPDQGSVTIEALGQFARESDFFAGLFTGDDVLVREAMKTVFRAIIASSKLGFFSRL